MRSLSSRRSTSLQGIKMRSPCEEIPLGEQLPRFMVLAFSKP
jgi:hypothetical protein